MWFTSTSDTRWVSRRIVARPTSARCECTATVCECIDEARSLANALGYEPRREVRFFEESAAPSEMRRQRACESLTIACRMQPLLREPQVIGHVPRRRLARGATPRRFAYYQGDAA